jgi:L-ascorbate metabolism protein UlaG (beta-lactamase superfamily)
MKLEDMGIKNATEEPDDYVKVTYLAHESMAPLNPNTPQNIMVHYKNAITHPGDSLQLKKTKDILFLPLAGPWGSAIGAVRMAERLRPKTIVPIHDWMWNEEWRSTMYKWLEQFFGEMGIRFIPAVDGKAFEV